VEASVTPCLPCGRESATSGGAARRGTSSGRTRRGSSGRASGSSRGAGSGARSRGGRTSGASGSGSGGRVYSRISRIIFLVAAAGQESQSDAKRHSKDRAIDVITIYKIEHY
tara:strand:- start:509 stop:844 length:336 start_codon:yes stop_codon:yes gene_type:complete